MKEFLPPIPPILLEGDLEPQVHTTGPGRRYARPPEAIEPATPATAEPEAWVEDYGLGRLWLAARDPHTLHASWDLTTHQAAAAGERLALRVFAGREPAGVFREVALPHGARSVFVPAEGAGEWFVATIGFTDPARGWQELARSTPVCTPPLATREAPGEQFVMLTLPPEPEEIVPRRDLVPPQDTPPEPVPAAPTPAVSVAPTSSPGEAAALGAAAKPPERPLVPPPATETAPGIVAPVPETIVGAATPLPQTTPPLATAPERPRLVSVAAPPWSPARAQEMTAALTAATVFVRPGSLEMAAGAGQVVCPAGPSSPAAGYGPGAGRGELPSSGAVPPPAAAGVSRGFWFNINAELIVYGATEPDAQVSVDGEPVPLRPDGSFTLRFALPDGEYALHAVAAAADGGEHRHARLTFARRTHYHGEVGTHPTDPTLQPPRTEGPVR